MTMSVQTGARHEPWKRQPLSIVVVGASGDLAKKKTYPSLLSLFADNLLADADNLVVYGYARSKMTHEELREKLRPYLEKKGVGQGVLDRFLSRCFYQSGASYG